MKVARPFVSLRDVTVQVDGPSTSLGTRRTLFEHLDWTIRGNEQWAVIGPNGSGKSMLMEVLAGQKLPANGDIQLHFLKKGESAYERIAFVSFDEQRADIGPDTFLQDRWNVGLREKAPTVAELLSARGIHRTNPFIVNDVNVRRGSGFAKRQGEVIQTFGLRSLLNERLIELSNGERRKVEIARAILKGPSLLILDNPFEGLDKRFRTHFDALLRKLLRTHMRLIIVGTERDTLPKGITHVLRVGADGYVSKEIFTSQDESRRRLSKMQGVALRVSNAGRVLLEMKHITVTYGKRHILRNVSWTVRKGEKWALSGPNGAGKTTLLSLITGDNPQAYANDITLFGKRRGSGESIWEIKRNIGSVSPELQLYYPSTGSTGLPQGSSGQAPHEVTCFDVACSGFFDSVGLYRKCTERQKKTARQWLKRLGVDKQANNSFAGLSEGEQRLALLARALVKSPKLLVLDEPCQGLDTHNRDRVLAAVDSVGQNRAITMIYVTHRLDELPACITDRFSLDMRS